MNVRSAGSRRAGVGFGIAAAGRRAGLGFALSLLCLSSCAYFNTFYNARSNFRKGEEDRQRAATASEMIPGTPPGVPLPPASGTGGFPGADSYQRCIDKCQLLLRYYPKSKYVDDALYLIGMSRLYRGEYVQSRAAFEELEDRFPKSEYIERAYYYSGLAALRQGDVPGAGQAFEKLATAFPDSKLNVEAVFRSAEARLDERDYEAARAALRQFMHDHPKSALAVDAQLRIARTYYDEARFEEARLEYARVLEMHSDPEARYEALLNGALAERAQAEAVLANPVLQRHSRMRRGGEKLGPDIVPKPATAERPLPGAPPGTAPPGLEEPGFERGAPPDSEGMARPDLEAEADTSAVPPPPDDSALAATDTTGAPNDSTAVAAADTTAPATLAADDGARLQAAEQSLDAVSATLATLRKPAAKLGRQVDLEIDLAVTRALCGEARDAVRRLDQLARAQPKSEAAARARYEIGEIHRRLGRFEKARAAYEESLKERRGTAISDLAERKRAAIVTRSQAVQRLREAPRVLEAWNRPRTGAADTTGAQLELQAKFEDLASQQLRVAEIDLLELGQPLVALDEFQEVLTRFPGSMQSARAAFGIAYVYDHELRDRERARAAYAAVARDYPETPQGREARAILDRGAAGGSEGQVH